MDTYRNRGDERADRDQQRSMRDALGVWDRSLRRDECSAWRISGKRGHIYTWGDGKTWVAWVGCASKRSWSLTKGKLAFAIVTQDGDEEGCFRIMQLPTVEQARALREVLGIRKKVELTSAQLEGMRSRGFKTVSTQLRPASPVAER